MKSIGPDTSVTYLRLIILSEYVKCHANMYRVRGYSYKYSVISVVLIFHQSNRKMKCELCKSCDITAAEVNYNDPNKDRNVKLFLKKLIYQPSNKWSNIDANLATSVPPYSICICKMASWERMNVRRSSSL